MKNLLISLSVSLIVGALTISKIKTTKYYELFNGGKSEITENKYKRYFFDSENKDYILKSETTKNDYSNSIKYSMLTFGSVLLVLTFVDRKKVKN